MRGHICAHLHKFPWEFDAAWQAGLWDADNLHSVMRAINGTLGLTENEVNQMEKSHTTTAPRAPASSPIEALPFFPTKDFDDYLAFKGKIR